MKKTDIRLRFAIVEVLLILIEFFIGIFVHDNFIRPYGGDIIVVVVLYALVRIVCGAHKRPVALYVFIFSFAYEFTQMIPLVDLLGIHSRFMRILMGTSFSWADILCYLTGCAICFGHDLFYMKKR